MDTRAWRFNTWHPNTHVFEVDTPTMSSFKQQVMKGLNPSRSKWSTVAADAREVSKLEQQLSAAGFRVAAVAAWQAATKAAGSTTEAAAVASSLLAGVAEEGQPCTLWLLEGFIGYISKDEGASLLRWMGRVNNPGSLLIMTAPPPPEEQRYNQQYKQESKRRPGQVVGEGSAERVRDQQLRDLELKGEGGQGAGAKQQQGQQGQLLQQQQKKEVGSVIATAPAQADGSASHAEADGINDAPPAAAAGSTTTAKTDVKLYHAVYEAAEETVTRVETAGWKGVNVIQEEVLASKYGVQKAQTIIKAEVLR